MTYLHDARALAADLTELRHALHQHPEVGLELPVTQGRVLDALAGLDLQLRRRCSPAPSPRSLRWS